MDVLFLGSGEFGLPTLDALARAHRVVGVVTQPDRPAGRGLRVAPTPVAAWCERHLAGVPIVRTPDINAEAVRREVRALAGAEDAVGVRAGSAEAGGKPGPGGDGRSAGTGAAWVVIAFGQKLSPELLAGVFACNLHASLLPRWRGAGPIQAAMLAGDEQAGNTVITIAQRMDAGLILGQRARAIGDTETAQEVHDALAAEGAPLMLDVLDAHGSGALTPRAQEESLVTRARKLSRADAWVDFSRPASECRRRINALSPWPGVTVTFRGESIKLVRAASVDTPLLGAPSADSGAACAPGRLVDAPGGVVCCGGESGDARVRSSMVRLLEVQPAGKRAMSWSEFAGGRRLTAANNGEAIEAGAGPC